MSFAERIGRMANDEQAEAPATTAFVLWLKRAAEARSIKTYRQLAQRVGLSHSTVRDIWLGATTPRMETVHKFAHFFRSDPEYLLALSKGERYTAANIPSSTLLDESAGILMVPVLDQEAGAGGGVEIVDYVYVPPSLVAGHRVSAVRVRGDCMAPRIEDGDVVIVDREAQWEQGRVVLADVDGSLLVKRFYRENHSIKLATDNPMYQAVYATEAQILGVVVYVYKRV